MSEQVRMNIPMKPVLLGIAACIALLLLPWLAPGLFAPVLRALEAGTGRAITLAAGPESAPLHTLAASLGEALARESPYEVALLPAPGALESVQLLRSGDADFALLPSSFSDGENGLAALARIATYYAHLIVPADSIVETFADLEGLRIGVGPSEGASAAIAQQAISFFGFSMAPELVTGHSPNLEEAFAAGEIDAAFLLQPLFAPEMDQLFASAYYRLIPMPEASAIAQFIPGLRAEALPSGLYGPRRNIPPSGTLVTTLAVDIVLATHANAPVRRVEPFLNAVADPLFRRAARNERWTTLELGEVGGIPLHAGAAAHFAAARPATSHDIRQFRTQALLAFMLLVLACLALWTRQRWRRAHLHNNAEPLFEQLEAQGELVESSQDVPELLQVLEEMFMTQRQAHEEWAEKRIHLEDLQQLERMYSTRSRNAYSRLLILQQAGAPINAAPRDLPTERPASVKRDPVKPARTPKAQVRPEPPAAAPVEPAPVSPPAPVHETATPETAAALEAASPARSAVRPVTNVSDTVRVRSRTETESSQEPEASASPQPRPVAPASYARGSSLKEPMVERWGDRYTTILPEPAGGARAQEDAGAGLVGETVEEGGVQWVYTGVGEGFSVPRPRNRRPEPEPEPEPEQQPEPALEAAPAMEPEPISAASAIESDVELDEPSASQLQPSPEEPDRVEASSEPEMPPGTIADESSSAAAAAKPPQKRESRAKRRRKQKRQQEQQDKEANDEPPPAGPDADQMKLL